MSPSIPPASTPLKCFVIMPFTKTTHKKGDAEVAIVPDQWKHIYADWIKKAVESFPDKKIVCKRSTATPGNFIKGIVKDLNDSHLVIADLTGNRPNVYYELGIRNALRTGTVMITQDLKTSLPSDLQTYYCFQYEYTEKSHEYRKAFAAFKKEMHEKLRFLISRNFPSDNPVSDFIDSAHYEQVRAFLRVKDAFLQSLYYIQWNVTRVVSLLSDVVVDSGTYLRNPAILPQEFSSQLDMTLVSSACSRVLFDFDGSLFPEEWFENMKVIVDATHSTLSQLIRALGDFTLNPESECGPLPERADELRRSLEEEELIRLIKELQAMEAPAQHTKEFC